MKNAVMMVVFNGLELTKQAYASVRSQNISGGTEVWLIDNGSTDGTWQWMLSLDPADLHIGRNPQNLSPLGIANREMATIFSLGYKKVFGVPNDVVLPPNMFRELDRWPRGIVTASMTDQKDFPRVDSGIAVNECTPLAMGLIRRWAYEALMAKDGYFMDEGFFHYASDMDLALRIAACGIRGVQLNIPYWHYGSAALKLSEQRRKMELQADADRSYFFRKWGFKVDDAAYGNTCGDINFKG